MASIYPGGYTPPSFGKTPEAQVVRDPTDLEIADYMAQARAIGSGSFESSAPSAEEFAASLPQMQSQAVGAASNPGAVMSPSESLNQMYGGAPINYGVPSLSAAMSQPRAPHFRSQGAGGQMQGQGAGGGQQMQQQMQQQAGGLDMNSLMELFRSMNTSTASTPQYGQGGPMAIPEHLQNTDNEILGRLLNG